MKPQNSMNNKPSEHPIRIESQRLILRPYQAGDGPMYFAVGQKNRQHLQRYEADNAILVPKNEQEAEALVQELAADWTAGKCYFLGAWDKASGEFVAQVYIGIVNRDTPEYEVGYFVDQEHEGKGYVTEAVRAAIGFLFRNLGAHRVRVHCDETNIRSRRVAERCGFVHEGLLREDTRSPDGLLTGTMVYGLLRREHERNQR